MASRLELSVVAKNQASKVLKQVGGDIRGLSKEAGNAKSSFNDMFSVAGGNLLARGIQSATSAVLGLGKAFVGTIADAANASAQMNAQVSGIGAVLGLTQDELVKVKGLINELGVDPNLKVNAQEAADAIDMLARNGLTLEQILGGAAEATVFLANATGGSFDTSANVATDTMAMFKIKAEDMMSAVNGITSVTVASKFGLDDYRLALAQAGGVASALGVEFADFNTSIAATSSSFASGSDAGTSFKTFLQRLVPQSAEAADAMAELGLYTFNSEKAMATLGSMGVKPLSGDMNTLITQLMQTYAATHKVNLGTEDGLQKFNEWAKEAGFVQNSFYDANGQLKDMASISTVLSQATAGLTEEQKNQYLTQIFGSDAMRTAFGLAEKGAVVYTDVAKAAKELGVSEADLAKYAEGGITAFEALQATMGKTDALKSAQMRVDNLSGDMEIFGGIVDSVKTQVGDRLQPALRTLFQEMTAALTAVTPQILAFGDALGTQVTNAVTRLTAAFNVFKAGGGIADIGKALGISPGVIAVIETVIQHIDLLKGALKGMAVAIGAGVAIAGVTAAITGLLNPITLVMAGAALLGAAWETNFGNIQGITADVTESIGNVVTAIQDFLAGADISAATTTLTQSFTGVKNALGELFAGDIGVSEFASKISDAVSGIPDMVRNVFAGADFSAMKGEIVTALGLDNISFDLSALQTNISTAIGGIDWSQVATQFNTLKDSVDTALNSVRDGVLSSLTAAVNGIDWSGVSSAFDALKTTVSSTLTGINWSEVLPNLAASASALRDNLIQSLADKINAIDWSQISLNVAGFINKIASTISNIDWSQAVVNVAGFISIVAGKISSIDWSQISVGEIGAALGAVVAPALTAGIAGITWVLSSENWGNLLSAVTGSIAEIDWGPIGEAFGNLATAVVDSVTNIDWSPIGGAFGSLATSVIDAITNIDWSGVSAPFYALKDSIQNAVNSALSTISFGFFGGGTEVGNNAAGTDNWKGGWTWVGEKGPELLNLPKGSQILSNDESKKMIGQLADGTTTAATVAPKGGGNVFSAIAGAAANFVKASDKLGKAGQVISDSMKDLEANLRKVPGLFGASQVTEQQMKMGALGIPQNFADDWLRRLTDEVVNGVNWEGVDIKDAALRAGLDPDLPAEAILELVTQKWNDKSLFANAANLDLINQDAVKQALEAQAQQAAGEQNLLNLFGVTPEQARTAGAATGTAAGGGMLTGITQSLTGSGAGTQVATSIATGVTPESMAPVGGSVVAALATELGKEEYGAQMGAALAGLFTGYLDKADAFVDVAQRIMSKIAAQFSNVGALDMVSRFVESFRAQLGSEDAISSLTAVGEKILELVFRGYLDESLRRNWAEGVNAKGDTSNKKTTTAGNAIGTSSWRGGMTWVGETGPELVSLPSRTRIFNPAESMALAGAGGGDVYVTVNATVSNAVDVEQLAYRVVDIIRKRR